MEHKVITEDEFYTRFTPRKNELGDNASFDGCMFETYGEELKIVQKINHLTPKRVWTIIECDGKMYYESGYHFVNRLGYLITEEEAEADVEYTVEMEDLTQNSPNTGKYQCGSCEQFFDELENGSCPHCGSGNFVEGCIDGPEPPEINKDARMEDEGVEHSPS